jgi:hypothetical protein
VLVEDFRRRFDFLQHMTIDFVNAVPDKYWDFSPQPPEPESDIPAGRHGSGFAPFCKQLRHVVCVRGVYADALVTGRADFASKHAHYAGGLGRDELVVALVDSHRNLLAKFDAADAGSRIDFFGAAFTLGDLAYTVVQHEAIHHGQWSIYAALAGFETPVSWRQEWGL